MEKRFTSPAMYREDCWSEGETWVLVEAWGEKYVELGRGNLRQMHWQEVADAVMNSRPAAARTRTGVQCKNRIDTLKKRYKAERSRSRSRSGSQWAFYDRLDALIGHPAPAAVKKSKPPFALPLTFRRNGSPALPVAAAVGRIPSSPAAYSGSSTSSEKPPPGKKKRVRPPVSGAGDGVGELARAIAWFGEMYERVEAAKVRQAAEMERERMEFAKGVELRRLRAFADAQVAIEKAKRCRRPGAGGEIGSLAGGLPLLLDSIAMDS